jgi:hypothetical protein
VAGRDITDGRSTRAIAVELGVGTGTIWQNTGNSFDCAIAGIPFLTAISDTRPYERATAPFRKPQFDSQRDPGEQSLTGWWLRSQSSFHTGEGIIFYDPLANPYSTTIASNSYRIANSYGVDIWTPGQVNLLKQTANLSGVTTGIYKTISIVDGSTDKILGWTPANTTIKSYTAAGTSTTYTSVVTAGLDTATLAIATDGAHLFVADNDHIYTGEIATPAAGYTTYYTTGSEKVVLGWVKQRLVACVGAGVYELTGTKGTSRALPTPVYTHPNADWNWTSISESGSAIYVSGYLGGNSAIYKFTLDTSGAMPTLTSGVVAAQLPIGEIVYKIESYLGYLAIGTNKGVRIASVNSSDGSIVYGPLIIETDNPVLDFAFRDRFVWATGSVGGFVGLYRIDLSNEIETLRFAWAHDTYLPDVPGYATSVDFVGNTNQIAFTTSGNNGIAIQSTTVLNPSGYLDTGYIRYNTLELKNFKRLHAQGDFNHGSLSLQTKDDLNNVFDVNSYDSAIGNPESTITQPIGAQDSLALRFVLYRDATDSTLGPVFKGYQLKAVPASPRQRIIKIPLLNYDTETDKYNSTIGYEGRAKDRLLALESAEATGDIVSWQDFRTGEIQQCLIEEVLFTDTTPPDKRLTGFGGIISLTIRTV